MSDKQQTREIDHIDIENLIVDAYRKAGEDQCRRVTRAGIGSLIEALTTANSQLADLQTTHDTAKKTIGRVYDLVSKIAADAPTIEIKEDAESATHLLLEVFKQWSIEE